MHRTAAFFAIAFVAVHVALGREPASPMPTGEPTGPALSRQVSEAFEARDYARALALLRQQLKERPQDPFVAYNLACAQSMSGDHAAAAETLIDAVAFGFSDLNHMERDAHLDPIHGEPSYAALVKGWRKVLDARGEADLKGARDALGVPYTYEQDPRLRLTFASAMNADSFAAAKREIERVAAWASANLDMTGSTDESRPDPWVMVVLPTPEDFAQLIRRAAVGGYYDRDRKRLVSQDIGATLRHEFFHVLHWRDMDERGQRHPYWIMEGLAALLEDVEDAGEGFRLAPSWRTNIAKRLGKSGRLTPWKDLFAMEREAFMGPRARANYAQSRAVLMFLHDRGVLDEWYGAYVVGFAEDSTGAIAAEQALGMSLKEAQSEFKEWLATVPMAGEQNRPGVAGIGVALEAGSGDGPVVAGIVAMSRAKKVGEERLRMRDVITAVDGRATRSLDEFHRILAEFEVGERVTLSVRRGARALDVRVELVPTEGGVP